MKTVKMEERRNHMAKSVKTEKLSIDYPKTDEIVWSGHYAVRITAPHGEKVEVSIDNGKWTPCRSAAGHWWLDIYGLGEGEHGLAVRTTGDKRITAAMRRFKVSHK